MSRLAGRRILVVGASGGLGQAIATRLHQEQASVAVAGRRLERLQAWAAEVGDRAVPIGCDVREPSSCDAVVGLAAEALEGLDGLVYAPGLAVITTLAKARSEHWQSALATNLIGAGLVTAAAIPHLEISSGAAVYLSSVSAHLTPPWKGMGLYLAAKVALEKCVEVWKLEHPTVRFTSLVIGSTAGGEFFPNAEKPYPDDIAGFRQEWQDRGYLAQEQLRAEDQAQAVVDILASRAQIDVMWSRPVISLQLWDPEAQ